MEALPTHGAAAAGSGAPAASGGPPARPPRWRAAALLGATLVLLGGAAVTTAASPAPSTSPSTDDSDDADGRARIGRTGAGLFDGFVGFAGRHGGLGLGNITITAIDGSSLTLSTVDGWTRTVEATGDTELTREGQAIALADLEVGDRIRFRQVEEDGTYTITAVEVVLPRIVGQVTAVDGNGLTLELPDGSDATVRIGDATEISVGGESDKAVSDIETGMVVIVAGEEATDGTFDAVSIRAGSIWQRFGPGGEDVQRGPFGRGFGPFRGGMFEGGPFWNDAGEPSPSDTPSSDTSAG